jgi:hypothetical protein
VPLAWPSWRPLGLLLCSLFHVSLRLLLVVFGSLLVVFGFVAMMADTLKDCRDAGFALFSLILGVWTGA